MEYECKSATERSFAKNIAYKNPKAIAKSVWKDNDIKEHLFFEILKEIKQEVKKYSKDPECILKVESPAVVTSFTNGAFFNQLQEKCPRLCQVFANVVKPGKVQQYSSGELQSHKMINAICLAAASCFKQYNQQLSAAHYRMSLLLLNGGAKAIAIERCSQLGVTVSHAAAVKMQTKAGQISTKCVSWKEDTLKKELQIKFLEEVINHSSAQSDSVPLDMSKDAVSSLKYYQEETYEALLAFISCAKPSGEITRNDLQEAQKEIKKSILHYKYVYSQRNSTIKLNLYQTPNMHL